MRTVIAWHLERHNTFVLYLAWGRWYGEWEGDEPMFTLATRKEAIAQAKAEIKRFLQQRRARRTAS